MFVEESPKVPAPGRRRFAIAIGAVTLVIIAVSSLRTEAGNEALDFWLQNFGGGRSYQRSEPAPADPQVRITVTPRRDREGESGGGSYCVRTCDGYYFPLSSARRSASEAREMCNSLCPGAATEVYQRRDGPDASFAQAVSHKGKPYSKLATAFSYREKFVAACTCHSVDKPSLAVTEDPTLKAGDIVVTNEGVKVFRSGRKNRGRDFVDYRGDRSVSKSQRTFLDAVSRRFHTAHASASSESDRDTKTATRKSGRHGHRHRRPATEQARPDDAGSAFAQGQENNP